MRTMFRMSETMNGQHHFVDPSYGDASDRRFYFRLDWGGDVMETWNPLSPSFGLSRADGVIFVEGLTAEEAPCKGSLRVDYLHERSIRYELEFEVSGKPFRYEGSKRDVDLRIPLMLVKTHTTCYGAISDAGGHVVSKSIAHFEPETLLPFLSSFRFHIG